MKKALITGGAGFIGSHIALKLLRENIEVAVVDNLSKGNKSNLPGNLSFYNVNILNEAELEEIFLKERPDYVIHQAAQVSVQSSMEDPAYDAKINTIGTLNLLRLSAKYKVKKFIFASTAAVYGMPLYLPIDELHPANPISFYGVSKLTSETYIQLFKKFHGLDYCILRYGNVYGPKQNAQGEAGVISIFIDRLLSNQPLEIYGDGKQTRDFIYVKDIANGCYLALLNGTNDILNLSTETQTSISDLAEVLVQISGRKAPIVYHQAKEGDIPCSCLKNQQAIEKLNWAPSYSLLEGLNETMEYYSEKRVK